MLADIQGLHHVTALASDAVRNNHFFTDTLGLRRVKKTVNFDAPDVYHLYYGDEAGTPGSVMTYFPFPNIARRHPGTGEVGETVFAVPEGTLDFWRDRLSAVSHAEAQRFGQHYLTFQGPDGDSLSVTETTDGRHGWTGTVSSDHAVKGFHSVLLRLADAAPTADLLKFMGYEEVASEGRLTRFALPKGNDAHVIDLLSAPEMPEAREAGGSVHHIAFSVADRAAQDRVRSALTEAGYRVTPSIDRDYFWAIYFRSPGGVLFEVATDEPGFARDEDPAHLGEALKLPEQHAHLREKLEASLAPIP